MKKKKGIQIETIFMILAILLLIALGVRGRLEVLIRSQDAEINRLKQEVTKKETIVAFLKEELAVPTFSFPLEKLTVSSPTGIRVNPLGGGTEALHKGIDLTGKKGTPIKSILPGEVVENWPPPGWYNGVYFEGHKILGGCIVIDHGDELFSIYGHLSKTFVHEEDWVEAGEVIGEMGSTGMSTGSHLHLELVINPFRYLKERRK